jgi:hypothetical protein
MRLLGRLFNHPDPMPAAKKKPAIFIPGSFASWCGRCWGAISTFTQDRDNICPRCGGTLQYIATSLRGPMEPPYPRRPFLRPKDPHTNRTAFLTEFRKSDDAA